MDYLLQLCLELEREKQRAEVGLLLPPVGGTMWKEFFRELPVKTVLPEPTDEETLRWGGRLCGAACLPMRAMAGQGARLLQKTQRVVVPPQACGGVFACTQPGRLPALLKSAVPKTGSLAAPGSLPAEENELAGISGVSPAKVRIAYLRARRRAEAMELSQQLDASRGPAVAVLGHPQLAGDPFLNGGLLQTLRARGLVPVMMPSTAMPPAGLRGVLALFERPGVRGVIYLVPEGCRAEEAAASAVERCRRPETPFVVLRYGTPGAEEKNTAALHGFFQSL